MILSLHGLTSNIEEQDIVTNFPAFGGARGYIIVTPQAPALVKHQTNDVVASKLILDFFDRHPGR